LQGPQSQDAAASPAILILSSGYRPIGSSTRLSGLSRSDFVLWHEADVAAGLLDVGLLGQSGHRADARPRPSSALCNRWPREICNLVQRFHGTDPLCLIPEAGHLL